MSGAEQPSAAPDGGAKALYELARRHGFGHERALDCVEAGEVVCWCGSRIACDGGAQRFVSTCAMRPAEEAGYQGGTSAVPDGEAFECGCSAIPTGWFRDRVTGRPLCKTHGKPLARAAHGFRAALPRSGGRG